MSITAAAAELTELKHEKQLMLKKTKAINSRIKLLEEFITEYLESRDQSKAKFQGKVFEVKSKSLTTPKKKTEREQDVKQLLTENGVLGVDNVYKELLRAQQGYKSEKKKLIIQTIKEKR